jgi:hypothetical protein
VALPSLRTVRAVFPHTALQSAVSTSGVPRYKVAVDRRVADLVRRRLWRFLSWPSLTPLPAPISCAPSGSKLPPHDLVVAIGLCTPSSPSGHYRCCLCFGPFRHTSTFLPGLPSNRFCSPVLSRLAPQRYYAGSDSCPVLAHAAGLSAYSALPSRHSAPTHALRPPVALSVASAQAVASRLRLG